MPGADPAERERAIVLLSGGIDSAVALWWARERYETYALSFDYHLRPKSEIHATVELAREAGVSRLVRVDLPFLREASDMPASLRLNPALEDAPEGYVPARNLVFYSLAAYHAEALGARIVVGGHHAVDGTLFPDASPAFFRRFEDLAGLGVWSFRRSPMRVELPLATLAKADVLELARRVGTPLASTWSCYADAPAPCGECRSCRERADAFASARLPDPAIAVTG